jgi:hypothetical protein
MRSPRLSTSSHSCYLDLETGVLSSEPRPGRTCAIENTLPGVRAPLVLRCAFHRQYEAVDTVVSADDIDLGYLRAAGLVQAALTAACSTCQEWRAATRAFQCTVRALRTSRTQEGTRDDNRLTLPVRSYLAIGQALNAPRPLLEALQALASMTLPCDPPPALVGMITYLRPDGALAFRRRGEPAPSGTRPLPEGPGWCLMRCAAHGWEHVGTLYPPDGKTMVIARELGHALLAQGAQTCEEYAMTRQVMDTELGAVAITNRRSALPIPPLEFFRVYRAVAAALQRATTDLRYVVARALEHRAAGDW